MVQASRRATSGTGSSAKDSTNVSPISTRRTTVGTGSPTATAPPGSTSAQRAAGPTSCSPTPARPSGRTRPRTPSVLFRRRCVHRLEQRRNGHLTRVRGPYSGWGSGESGLSSVRKTRRPPLVAQAPRPHDGEKPVWIPAIRSGIEDKPQGSPSPCPEDRETTPVSRHDIADGQTFRKRRQTTFRRHDKMHRFGDDGARRHKTVGKVAEIGANFGVRSFIAISICHKRTGIEKPADRERRPFRLTGRPVVLTPPKSS